MGYMHIDNLYKCPQFFKMFSEVYALEKIHGTSVWIIYNAKSSTLKFHSGGEKHDDFVKLFDETVIHQKLYDICNNNRWSLIKVHGEAYGGKQQRMSHTYGPTLKFIVFDVYVENVEPVDEVNLVEKSTFLSVPDAEIIAQDLNLEFVHYVKIQNTSESVEAESNKESIQAIRNGVGSGKNREGIVVKPLFESRMPNGKRAIFKHKNADFWEIKTRRPLGEKLKIVDEINEIVDDWVTDQRFEHVKDRVLQEKVNKIIEAKDIKIFLDLMVEDVKRESEGEVIWTNDLIKLIRQKTASMLKKSGNFVIKM